MSFTIKTVDIIQVLQSNHVTSGIHMLNSPPNSVPIAVLSISLKSKFLGLVNDCSQSQNPPATPPTIKDIKGTPTILL